MKNHKLRFNRNLRIFAGLVLLFLTVLCYATDIGTGIGVTTAIAGVVAVPQLTEKETQFVDHVKGEVSRELEKFSKGYISETKLNEILSQKMAGWMDKKPELLDELKSALETQGLEITKLKMGGSPAHVKGLHQQILDQLAGKTPQQLMEEKGKIKLSLKAASAGVVNNVSGEYIYSRMGPGEASWDRAKYPQSWVRDFADVGPTSFETLTYVEATLAGGADFKAQNTAKAGVGLEYGVKTMSARKLTAFTKFPTEMLKDVPNFMAELLNWVTDEVVKKENTAFITGSGTAPQCWGIKTLSTAIGDPGIYTSFPGWTAANVTEYDILLLAIAAVQANNFMTNVIIINPATMVNLLAIKTSTPYQVPQLMQVNGVNQLTMMGIPIIQDTNMTADNFVVGDAKRFRIRDYEDLIINFGTDTDDFSKNMISVVAEKRLMTYVPTEQKKGLITGVFAAVKTALGT